ncbi:hypothetical protein QQ008_29590 [Fulvivirgaceae bacterium BMA10]|uniref:Uncharacterized protein n=1 Tax=Splendidivirga corallicola TaxID=3051826 RepID=A0ABT8KZL6_9BACT|nr:hypothetical protein [Fulvivirgaceae bacterium BMA10]
MNNINYNKIGAIFFILWGVLHVFGGGALMLSATTNINEHLQGTGTGASNEQLPNLMQETVVSGIASFHSFNLFWMGLLVTIIAVMLNWKGSKIGFWINLAITGMADLGLLLFLVGPGYMFWSDGLPGPILFILCVLFSGLGIWKSLRGNESLETV